MNVIEPYCKVLPIFALMHYYDSFIYLINTFLELTLELRLVFYIPIDFIFIFIQSPQNAQVFRQISNKLRQDG